MKKLLSLLAIGSLSLSISNSVTSCFLFPKKETLFDQVYNKINDTDTNLTWENKEAAGADGKVNLNKDPNLEEGQLPETWTILLTDLFDLQSNSIEAKNEFHFITNISSKDNILENNQAEEVFITLSKVPKNPTEANSKTIIKTITWTTGQASDEELANEIINEINNPDNIYALGLNISSDADDSLTKRSIMNNIGLNTDQKAVTTLSGTLIEDRPADIKFNIKINDVEKNTTKNVTWYKESPTFTSRKIEYTILINGYIYAGSRDRGLYRSEDGVIFEPVDATTLGSKRCNVIYQTKNGDIYVCTRENGLYKSTDGNNFKKIEGANIEHKDFISIIEGSNGYIYAGTGVTSKSGIFISKDGGNSFEQMDNSLKSREINSLKETKNGDIFAATDYGLYKSLKNSDDFEKVASASIGSSDVYTMEFINNNLYLGTYGAIWKSSNYEDFNKINASGLDNLYIYSIFKASDNNLYIGSKNYGLYVSDDNEKTFAKVSGTLDNELSHIQEFKNTLLLSYDMDFSSEETYGLHYYYLNL